MAFTYYDEIPSTGPTTQEILTALTGLQKTAILDGFANSIPPTQLKQQSGIYTFAIRHLYQKIDEIEETSRLLMRGEYITGYDSEGQPIYAAVPISAAELLVAVKDEFANDFTEAQITAVLTKMVEYSKHDGTGDWAYYSTEVIK